MKTYLCMFVMFISAISFGAVAFPVIELHVQCESGPDCKEMKSPTGDTIRVEKAAAMSFSPETVAEASVSHSNDGRENLSLTLTKEAAGQFEKLTRDNQHKVLALTIGDRVLTAPTVMQTISGGRMSIETKDKLSVLDEVPWLKEKVLRDETDAKRKSDRDMVLYAAITGLLLVGTLVFAFRRDPAGQSS